MNTTTKRSAMRLLLGMFKEVTSSTYQRKVDCPDIGIGIHRYAESLYENLIPKIFETFSTTEGTQVIYLKFKVWGPALGVEEIPTMTIVSGTKNDNSLNQLAEEISKVDKVKRTGSMPTHVIAIIGHENKLKASELYQIYCLEEWQSNHILTIS